MRTPGGGSNDVESGGTGFVNQLPLTTHTAKTR